MFSSTVLGANGAGLLTQQRKENTVPKKECVAGSPWSALVSRLCTFLPLLLITGCYDFEINGSLTSPTVSVSAQPSSIPAGSSSTLTVAAANAFQVTMTGSDGSSYSLQPGGGTATVKPSETTTYTAIATGPDGKKSASAAVAVTPAENSGSAPTVTIGANPDEILPGGSTMLTVTAKNAEELIVTGTNGSKYYLHADGGTQKVTPAENTTYTATATGADGKASAKTTVTVTPHPRPIVTFEANPIEIRLGDSSVLTVSAKYATEVILTGTNGTKYTLHADGTQKVVPYKTTTYTATATGAGGKESAKLTVEVVPPSPVVTITAFPKSIAPGRSSILTITATHATEVIVTGSNGSKFAMPATGGKHAISPTATTKYTVTATGAGGKASAATTVTVVPNPPPSVDVTANPTAVVAGHSSTLTVTAMHATNVTVKGSDGTSYTLKSDGGTQTVTPTVTTTYTATASGPGGNASANATVNVTPNPPPSVTITANPATITSGNSSTLKVTATNATQVTITGDGALYSLEPDGGSQVVSPTATTSYTATATGPGGTASSSTTVTVNPAASLQSIDHVIFMLQENHSFDNYFGMLNPYRTSDGKNWNIGDDGVTYTVDGIDDKTATISDTDDEGTSYSLFPLASTCIDDDSSDWLASYGDVNRYDFQITPTPRPILENGFVHTAEGYAKSCAKSGTCGGSYTDLTGQRAMGYYDDHFLNYYYYMASQFALSDRWFSPVASKSIDNRIATFTGGTTQGLTKDPANDKLSQLDIPTIFEELDQAGVSWKIYYTVTQGFCLEEDDCTAGGNNEYPATDFSNLNYSFRYLHENPSGAACTAPTQGSKAAVDDPTNSFCIDTEHIAPLSTFFSDLTNGTLPSFAFIEAGYGRNDEHPGSEQSILHGQAEMANILNSFMDSPEWSDSVFFLSYDEGGGPYDHVPPVPGHSNDYTDSSLASTIPDISAISVNPDSYYPCLPGGSTPYCDCPPGDTSPSLHCDLVSTDPGATAGDAPYEQGFAAQLGFRVPNMIVSPFARRHYVSHIPMDHTAVIQFVENRFITGDPHLTARDAAQPDLLDFFDFNTTPWATPPTPPVPYSDPSGQTSCNPTSMGP
jgi:phospholipase C